MDEEDVPGLASSPGIPPGLSPEAKRRKLSSRPAATTRLTTEEPKAAGPSPEPVLFPGVNAPIPTGATPSLWGLQPGSHQSHQLQEQLSDSIRNSQGGRRQSTEQAAPLQAEQLGQHLQQHLQQEAAWGLADPMQPPGSFPGDFSAQNGEPGSVHTQVLRPYAAHWQQAHYQHAQSPAGQPYGSWPQHAYMHGGLPSGFGGHWATPGTAPPPPPLPPGQPPGPAGTPPDFRPHRNSSGW